MKSECEDKISAARHLMNGKPPCETFSYPVLGRLPYLLWIIREEKWYHEA